MHGERTGVGAAVGRPDPDQQLPMQPAPAISGAEETALERLQRGIAKNSTDDGPVAQPFLLCRRLVAPRGTRGNFADLVRSSVSGVQRRRNRTECRRVDAVPGPLQLDAF